MQYPTISEAINLIKKTQAELREEILSIDRAIQMLLSDSQPQQQLAPVKKEKKEKVVRYIKLDDGIKRKRGRPAKVIYVQEKGEEKKEKLGLSNKILRILRSKYRFMHESEIVAACINNYASERALPKAEVAKRVSDTLKALKKDNELIEFTGLDMKKTYWGFEEWLNGKGNIKEENKYITSN